MNLAFRATGFALRVAGYGLRGTGYALLTIGSQLEMLDLVTCNSKNF